MCGLFLANDAQFITDSSGFSARVPPDTRTPAFFAATILKNFLLPSSFFLLPSSFFLPAYPLFR
jgi:hypothetical protein